MNILTFFTKEGNPKQGLIPAIKIVNITTTTVEVLWESMDEVSDGWYKYNFINYNYQHEYIVTIDGGIELTGAERWNAFASDNSRNEIGKIVWNAKIADHQELGSFGKTVQTISDDIKRTLGLLHENIYIDNPIYDINNNLINARVRIYSNSLSVGTDNDVIGSYFISSNGDGSGKFTHWSQIKL